MAVTPEAGSLPPAPEPKRMAVWMVESTRSREIPAVDALNDTY